MNMRFKCINNNNNNILSINPQWANINKCICQTYHSMWWCTIRRLTMGSIDLMYTNVGWEQACQAHFQSWNQQRGCACHKPLLPSPPTVTLHQGAVTSMPALMIQASLLALGSAQLNPRVVSSSCYVTPSPPPCQTKAQPARTTNHWPGPSRLLQGITRPPSRS